MGKERQEVIDAVHKIMCCDVMQEHGAKVIASMAVSKEGRNGGCLMVSSLKARCP